MIKLFLFILPFLILFLPNIWVNYIFKKYNKILPDMPFTGKQLGQKILKEIKLEQVLIETIQKIDHYNPLEKKVKMAFALALILF